MTVTVFLAGVAGGTVEVVWVILFCLMSPLLPEARISHIALRSIPNSPGTVIEPY